MQCLHAIQGESEQFFGFYSKAGNQTRTTLPVSKRSEILVIESIPNIDFQLCNDGGYYDLCTDTVKELLFQQFAATLN